MEALADIHARLGLPLGKDKGPESAWWINGLSSKPVATADKLGSKAEESAVAAALPETVVPGAAAGATPAFLLCGDSFTTRSRVFIRPLPELGCAQCTPVARRWEGSCLEES